MRLSPLIAAPAAALLLASCAASDPAGDAADEATPAMTADAAAESADAMEDEAMEEADPQNAFAFTATTVADGAEFDGLSIDDTDVVLWFWAPWCSSCQLQSRTINEVIPNLPEEVPMIGIAGMDDDLEFMREFVDVTGVDEITHVADLDGEIWKRFGITQTATLVFIDDSGDAQLLGSGATAEEIVAAAEALT